MDEVRRSYAAVAEQYIDLFGTTAKMHDDDLALIRCHLSIHPGVVLDNGCGPGHLTAYLRSLDVDAYGIDLVTEFIDHARVSYPCGRYEIGSMHRLPFADHSVAGILAWYSLIHLCPDELDGVLLAGRRTGRPPPADRFHRGRALAAAGRNGNGASTARSHRNDRTLTASAPELRAAVATGRAHSVFVLR